MNVIMMDLRLTINCLKEITIRIFFFLNRNIPNIVFDFVKNIW